MIELSLNRSAASLLSLFLYIGGTIMGIGFNFFVVPAEYFKVDIIVVTTFFVIAIIHELTHFIGYKLIGRLKKGEIIFIRDKKHDIPYFKSHKLLEKKYIIVSLLLPAISTTLMVISINYFTGNLAYAFLFGISLAYSGADIEMSLQLAKKESTHWKSLEGCFGFSDGHVE